MRKKIYLVFSFMSFSSFIDVLTLADDQLIYMHLINST